MSLDSLSSFGDAVANETASQPLLGCCDSDSASASASTSTSTSNNSNNTFSLLDHDVYLGNNDRDTFPPPPYKEIADTSSTGALASSNSLEPGSQRVNTAAARNDNVVLEPADLAARLVTYPCIPLIMVDILIILILHITALQTMGKANKVPVYIAALMVLFLALSLPYAPSWTGNDGTNDGTNDNCNNYFFASRSFARLLLALDAALLAGVHLFYLKDMDFDDGNHFLFGFF